MTDKPDHEAERLPAEQCPQCGRDLPETTPGDDGAYWVSDGDPLGCGCAGAWSCDGEGAFVNHDDEECNVCRDDEIEYLKKKLADALAAKERAERERDIVTSGSAMEVANRMERERDDLRAKLAEACANERERIKVLAMEMADDLESNGRDLVREYGADDGRVRELAAGEFRDLALCLFTEQRMDAMASTETEPGK